MSYERKVEARREADRERTRREKQYRERAREAAMKVQPSLSPPAPNEPTLWRQTFDLFTGHMSVKTDQERAAAKARKLRAKGFRVAGDAKGQM